MTEAVTDLRRITVSLIDKTHQIEHLCDRMKTADAVDLAATARAWRETLRCHLFELRNHG